MDQTKVGKVKGSRQEKNFNKKSKKNKKEAKARKALEEAERKKRLEIEEKERIERERIEAEEKARLEELERLRRLSQISELSALYDGMNTMMDKMQENHIEERVWDRYMRDDGTPNPTIPGEINTYLNVQREADNLTFDEVLKESIVILSLIEEIGFILEDPSPELKSKEAEFKQTRQELESLLQFKLDQGTHRVLRDASERADPETGNLISTLGGNVITLSCWGNMANNPRLKRQVFSGPAFGVVFEVPLSLIRVNCAVRFLRTEFDHLTHSSALATPHRLFPLTAFEDVVVPSDEAPATEPITAADIGVGLGDPVEGADLEPAEEDKDVHTPPMELASYLDFKEPEGVINPRAYMVVGGILHFDLLQLPPQPRTVRNWTMAEVDQPAMIKQMEYGRFWRIEDENKIHKQSIKSRATTQNWSRNEPVILEEANENQNRYVEDSVHKRPKSGLDGPSQSLDAQPNLDSNSNLHALTEKYGLSVNQEVDPSIRKSKSQTIKEALSRVEKPPNLPFGITFRLPEDCVFFEPPIVARWDPFALVWRTTDIEDVEYDPDTKSYSFKTFYFGAFACLQDRHINFPFKGWELRPFGEKSALFTINAAMVDVEIEIKGNKCCLRQPKQLPQFEDVLGKWVVPKTLIRILKSKGINIFPEEDSRKYVVAAYEKKWMQEHKSELWGLFLFPEEFLIPEPEPEPEEDDFFAFLKGKEEPPPEPEPVVKTKKGKKGKKEKSKNQTEAKDSNSIVDWNESALTSSIGSSKKSSKNESSKPANSNKAKKKKSNTSVPSTMTDKSKKKKKKTKEIPKTPQQLLWESFNEWKKSFRRKHPWIEGNLYQQMALCAHVLGFSYSRWNTDAGETRLVLRAAESLTREPINEDSWEVYAFTSKRVMPLAMKEGDETFSETIREGLDIQSNFYHMALHFGSPNLIQTIKEVDYSFVKAVKELLDATQVMTFA